MAHPRRGRCSICGFTRSRTQILRPRCCHPRQERCISDGVMLDVYLHDAPDLLKFRLAGELAGGGVPEVEQSWRTARSVSAHKRLMVDVTGVVAVDAGGERLIAEMAAAGAVFVTGSPFTDRLARRVTQREPKPLAGGNPGALRLFWCRLSRCCRAIQASSRPHLPCAALSRKIW